MNVDPRALFLKHFFRNYFKVLAAKTCTRAGVGFCYTFRHAATFDVAAILIQT